MDEKIKTLAQNVYMNLHEMNEIFVNDESTALEMYIHLKKVEKLMGKEMNGPKDADIICSINSSADWYFGTNGNTPNSKYDLVTVALHEITHGLGFAGFFDDEDGVGKLSNPTNSPSAARRVTSPAARRARASRLRRTRPST